MTDKMEERVETEVLMKEAREEFDGIPPDLREHIVLEHTTLVRYIVNRIAVRLPSHIDLDDLHNTGIIGLMDAIEKYDHSKNCKFKTYAEFRIKGAILDQLRSLDWVPRSVRQKGRKLERAYSEVEQRLGRQAKEEEVADSLGLELDKFHVLINQVRGISLVNLEEIRGTNSDGDQAGTFADIIEAGADGMEVQCGISADIAQAVLWALKSCTSSRDACLLKKNLNHNPNPH